MDIWCVCVLHSTFLSQFKLVCENLKLYMQDPTEEPSLHNNNYSQGIEQSRLRCLTS